MDDEKGRTELADFLGTFEQRVYHVGRLDADSEGLLLLTNDGSLAHKLMHPSYGVAKTYLAEVVGPLPRTVGRALQAGVELEDGPARVDSFRLVDTLGRTAQVEITLHEGRKHIVRRMMDAVGHPGDAADPDGGRADPAGRPAAGRVPAVVERRDRRAVQGCGGLAPCIRAGSCATAWTATVPGWDHGTSGRSYHRMILIFALAFGWS